MHFLTCISGHCQSQIQMLASKISKNQYEIKSYFAGGINDNQALLILHLMFVLRLARLVGSLELTRWN
jgi:hypothetical protein